MGLLLVGFEHHRSNAEAKGDGKDDGEQRNPHGYPPRWRNIARGKSGQGNASMPIWFLGSITR
jgi:hypothetical protein